MRISALSAIKNAHRFNNAQNAICDIVLTVLISAMRVLLYYARNAMVEILLNVLPVRTSHVLSMFTLAQHVMKKIKNLSV